MRAIELNGYGIKYQARTSIKGQALVDIFAECTHNPKLKKDYTPEISIQGHK